MVVRRTRRGSVAIVTSIIAGTAIVVSAIAFFSRPALVPVQVASPQYQEIDSTVSTNGKVIPVENFVARAAFPGVIDKVYVHAGEKVHAGQMLLELKDSFAASRIATARAALQSAEVDDANIKRGGSQEDKIGVAGDVQHARLEQRYATDSLATLQRLEQTGAASPAEVNGAKQRLQTATITLNTITNRDTDRYSAADKASWAAKVADARAALLAQTKAFGDSHIASPINGTVYIEPVSLYDFVQTGADLLHVADLSRLQVVALFDEPDVEKLHKNQPVRIKWQGSPNRVWHGYIKQPPLATMPFGTRSVGRCLITIDDAHNDLPPDTDVVVNAVIKHNPNALTVPREALQSEGKSDFVYRVVGDRLVKTPVRVGIVNLYRAEIISGITPKDRVALHLIGEGNLSDDLRVRPSD